jgi:hypothetical protein
MTGAERELAAALAAMIGEVERLDAPIDMLLYCPMCGLHHIDEATEAWGNPPHRSHLCYGCGHIWRPCDRPTNGVAAIETKGKADGSPRPAKPASDLAKLRREVEAMKHLRFAVNGEWRAEYDGVAVGVLDAVLALIDQQEAGDA